MYQPLSCLYTPVTDANTTRKVLVIHNPVDSGAHHVPTLTRARVRVRVRVMVRVMISVRLRVRIKVS